jgi:hypothetical protein
MAEGRVQARLAVDTDSLRVQSTPWVVPRVTATQATAS